MEIVIIKLHWKPSEEKNQVKCCTVLEDQRCLSLLITTISGIVNAKKKKVSPCTVNVKGWSETQCETANEDKRGQESPGPGVTHSQDDMAHYDSPFAVGLEHKRERGEGRGGVVCEEERQLTPNGEKRAISNQVPSAAQFAMGQNTSVIRFLVTISPNLCAQCCPSATGMRTMKGIFHADFCHRSALQTNFGAF